MPAARKIRPAGGDRVSVRITRLINDRFDGNVTVAAAEIGCMYDQLWRACTGRYSRGVPLGLVMEVCGYFNVSIDSLTGEEEFNATT